jgi:hypothetical protein
MMRKLRPGQTVHVRVWDLGECRDILKVRIVNYQGSGRRYNFAIISEAAGYKRVLETEAWIPALADRWLGGGTSNSPPYAYELDMAVTAKKFRNFAVEAALRAL